MIMEREEQLKSEIPEKLKKEPRSQFLVVECPDCSSNQVIYSHASTKVECSICGRTLVEPTGGRARIHGEILKEYPG